MKKSLLVALLATLGVAGVATAQTSVTVYGTVDAGVAYNHGSNNAGKVISLESGQQSYSRIGFKGTEDLGNGMKALFLLEQGVQIDTGDSGYSTLGSGIFSSSGTFSSQAYVGLSSNVAGKVTLGRQFSPLYEAYGEIDPFQNGFAANMNSFFGTIPASNNLGLPDRVSPYQRMDNAVIYHTPDNLWGFKGALAYGFGEVAGSTGSDAQFGVSLVYANGPLTVAYAFHHANNDSMALDAFKTHFIGATWDFNVAKVHAAFDQNKISDLFKTQDYMIGVSIPWGASSVFADYTHKKDKTLDHANANQFALGYTHALSKRTNLYTAYTYVKNNSNSQIDTDTPGNNVNTFQVGVRHQF